MINPQLRVRLFWHRKSQAPIPLNGFILGTAPGVAADWCSRETNPAPQQINMEPFFGGGRLLLENPSPNDFFGVPGLISICSTLPFASQGRQPKGQTKLAEMPLSQEDPDQNQGLPLYRTTIGRFLAWPSNPK